MAAYAIDPILPWTGSERDERRFRKILTGTTVGFLLVGLVLSVLHLPKPEVPAAPEIPPRIAKLVLEKRTPPPPPPPPPPKVEEQPKPELAKPEAVKPEAVARPQPAPTARPTPEKVEVARKRASQAGLMPFKEELASLQDLSQLASLQQDNLTRPDKLDAPAGPASDPGPRERSLITAKVGSGSGGIDTGKLSRDTGGGGGQSVGTRQTAHVASPVIPTAAPAAPRAPGKKAARSDQDIQRVFDRNKGAIYAIYNRALRSNPALQGKLVLRLTIAPDGVVTRAEIISSELNDEDLERKLLLRVKQFDFGGKDVETITVTYPIDFLPS